MRRRNFLGALAAVPLSAAAKIETRSVPVEKAFDSPCEKPNGLQATSEGLWILNQGGDNSLYLVDWNGKLIEKLATESVSGSGVTFDGKNLWLASTYNCKIIKTDRKGKTIASYATPGCGKVNWPNPRRSPLAPPPAPASTAAAVKPARVQPDTGAHGMEYRDGKLWIAVPPAKKIYRVKAEGFQVEHEFATAGDRPHGLGWDGKWLWCADSNMNAFHKYDAMSGEVHEKIQLSDRDPLPHGMTIWKGTMWYCDDVGVVCRLKL
jgi:sugar lactone lactonase YvrE